MSRILIVEDDPFIAYDLGEQLTAAGFTVVGKAQNVEQALDLIASESCDAGVLDVNLGSETSEPVAHNLLRRGIPFIAVSGYSAYQQPPVFAAMPRLTKPIEMSKLIAALTAFCRGKNS